MKKCQFCNAEIDDDATFCPSCGKAVTSTPAPSAPADGATAETDSRKPSGWKKIVTIVGACCAAAAVVISLIFVFLTGVVQTASESYEGIKDVGKGQVIGLSYFFKDAFDAIKSAIDRMGNASDVEGAMWQLIGMLFQNMFGTIIIIAMMITIFIMAIIAIIRFIKYFTGESDKSIGKCAIATYGVYALGASLIRSLFAYKITVNASDFSGVASFHYNGATVAGLTLGGICLALYAASKIAVLGKDIIKPVNLCRIITCACTLICIAILWDFATGGLVGMSLKEDGMSHKEAYGFLPLLQNMNINRLPEEEIGKSILGFAFCALGPYFIIGLICLLRSLLTRTFLHLTGETTKPLLSKSIFTLIFALIVTIMAVMSLNTFFTVQFGDMVAESGYKKYMAPAIVVTVMAVLTLAGVIVEKVLANKFGEEHNA